MNSLETISNFVKSCSNLITDDVGIYLSDLVTKIFKDVCLDTKVWEKIPELIQINLKQLIFGIFLNFNQKFFLRVKKILSQLNILCFADLVANLAYLGKVPKFLLDKEERRMIRIAFAELESYMILIPDSLERPRVTYDNIE
jgi:hypothetical protein